MITTNKINLLYVLYVNNSNKNIQKPLVLNLTIISIRCMSVNMTSTKRELKRKENQERLTSAVATLDIITKNNNIQRNVRAMVKEVLGTLKDEKGGSISVRTANAISMLDTVTQNPQIQSHIRTMLWQVVSTLESIRE